MKLNCRLLWKKFQRDGGLNISIQMWIITQSQKRLSERGSKFNKLFDKGFKIIKTFVMTHMENMIKFTLSLGLFTFFPVVEIIWIF